jgi:hypothetical protein
MKSRATSNLRIIFRMIIDQKIYVRVGRGLVDYVLFRPVPYITSNYHIV